MDAPSPFIVEWSARLADRGRPRRRALDVAMGRGRHVEALARAGYRVFGTDIKLEALRDAVALGAARGVSVAAWCADLTAYPLPGGWFDLVVVTRYLQRDLFPSLRQAIVPGGAVLYETFTELQRACGWGPQSPDHLLTPGELRGCFDGFEVLFYEEAASPEAVARIAAIRRDG
jgi:tellurite methyltransferase